jgi:hypothetical protein
MRLISDDYRLLQRKMHARNVYGDSGGKWRWTVAGIASAYRCESILDYGCGTGALKRALPWVEEYDPGVPGKDESPQEADLVCCIDTLEHIEPECLEDVVRHLRMLTRVMLFTVISTRLAGKVLPDGRNAHLIVQPKQWWHDNLSRLFARQHSWVHTADEWCALWF